jgi:hypothetical protein
MNSLKISRLLIAAISSTATVTASIDHFAESRGVLMQTEVTVNREVRAQVTDKRLEFDNIMRLSFHHI